MPVRPTSSAARDRDAALVNMRRTRRALAGVASILVVGFGALAAHASASKNSTSTSSAGTTSSTSSSDDDGSSSFSDSQAPQTTSQSPAVTSGGS